MRFVCILSSSWDSPAPLALTTYQERDSHVLTVKGTYVQTNIKGRWGVLFFFPGVCSDRNKRQSRHDSPMIVSSVPGAATPCSNKFRNHFANLISFVNPLGDEILDLNNYFVWQSIAVSNLEVQCHCNMTSMTRGFGLWQHHSEATLRPHRVGKCNNKNPTDVWGSFTCIWLNGYWEGFLHVCWQIFYVWLMSCNYTWYICFPGFTQHVLTCDQLKGEHPVFHLWP